MSSHHLFNVHLAALYGIEEAILIHHFQNWISYNKELDKNCIDGRTWLSRTRKQIAVDFPYWNEEKVRRLTDRLVKLNILLKENYNETKVDKTLWYAFENEGAFLKVLSPNT